jgi:hypothetical protein
MRKPLLSVFFIAVMVGGLAFAASSHSSTVQAATEVNGIINSGTTWTKANSPYVLTGNVLVNKGVTLTIEAGVTVNFVGYYIEVNGTLVAKGVSSNPINFTGGVYGVGNIIFTQYSTGWNQQTNSGSILENVNGAAANVTGASPKITNGRFGLLSIHGGSPIISYNEGYEVDVYAGTPLILGNNFNDFIAGNVGQINLHGGSPTISNNTISGKLITINGGDNTIYAPDYGIYLNGNNIDAYIANNIISSYGVAGINALSGTTTIERNYINNSQSGISVLGNANLIIQNNTIVNNDRGISATSPSNLTITYNNIENNTLNLFLGSTVIGGANPADINAANNWWGTTDTSVIDEKIYDYNDDFNLGKVNYTPFLTEANTQAVPDPNAPLPTTPAQTPSTSPTPTPSQEPQQTQIEEIAGVAITAVVIGAGLGLLIYLIKRK